MVLEKNRPPAWISFRPVLDSKYSVPNNEVRISFSITAASTKQKIRIPIKQARTNPMLLTNIHPFSLLINKFHLFRVNVFITVYKREVRLGSHVCSPAVSERETQSELVSASPGLPHRSEPPLFPREIGASPESESLAGRQGL